MATVTVRYIVRDVDEAIAFYAGQLGFDVVMHPAPPFAMLARGDLRLLLSAPSGQSGGGQILPGDRRPEPGGWNRFQLAVTDRVAGGILDEDLVAADAPDDLAAERTPAARRRST